MESAMRILVTGGSGFLGSHVADALTNAGHEVVIYDAIESAYLLPQQTMVVGNILDRKLMFQTLKRIDMVFHLAALADINITWDNPYETMKVNVLGTTNVLEACRLNGVKKVIFASTIYVASHTGELYRTSKHSGELLVKAYRDYCGLDYVIIRFGTLYGTRSKPNNSIHRLLKEALDTGIINYYGTGNEIREYLNVKDAGAMCTKLLDDKYVNQTLILTGYHRTKLTDLLDMINEILGKKITINYFPKNSKAHYEQVPYSYMPEAVQRLVPETYTDFGGGLVDMLKEIDKEEERGH